MNRREHTELERGTHPFWAVTEQEQRLYIQGREDAAAYLADCRTACDVAADSSYDLQEKVVEELIRAKAVAQEWGVYS